jgi:hypothetical protein
MDGRVEASQEDRSTLQEPLPRMINGQTEEMGVAGKCLICGEVSYNWCAFDFCNKCWKDVKQVSSRASIRREQGNRLKFAERFKP